MPTKMSSTDLGFILTPGQNVRVSSLKVAEVFGKRHDNVLRDIENLECSEKFNALNFEDSFHTDKKTNIRIPIVTMTRDGFVILAMGFTGRKAMQFKEAYIDLFNQYEQTAAVATVLRTLEIPEPKRKQFILNALKQANTFVTASTLATTLGWSLNTVQQHLTDLVGQDYLTAAVGPNKELAYKYVGQLVMLY